MLKAEDEDSESGCDSGSSGDELSQCITQSSRRFSGVVQEKAHEYTIVCVEDVEGFSSEGKGPMEAPGQEPGIEGVAMAAAVSPPVLPRMVSGDIFTRLVKQDVASSSPVRASFASRACGHFLVASVVDANGRVSLTVSPAVSGVTILWRRVLGDTLAVGQPLFAYTLTCDEDDSNSDLDEDFRQHFGANKTFAPVDEIEGFARGHESDESSSDEVAEAKAGYHTPVAMIGGKGKPIARAISRGAAAVNARQSQARKSARARRNSDSDSSDSSDSSLDEPLLKQAFLWPADLGAGLDTVTVTQVPDNSSQPVPFRKNAAVICLRLGESPLLQGLHFRMERQLQTIQEFLSSNAAATVGARAAAAAGRAAAAAEKLDAMLLDFRATVEIDARKIVEENALPEEMRSHTRNQAKVGDVEVGGVAGGRKFICDGILFKFLDPKEVPRMYAGMEERVQYRCMHKASGGDLKGYCAVFQYLWNNDLLERTKLRTSYQLLVDYCGFRVLAQLLLPISGSETLVYGTANGGDTFINCNSEAEALCRKLGESLGLEDHAVRGQGRTNLASDVECHLGRDSRFYLIDLGRLLPPLPCGKGEMALVFTRDFRKEAVAFLAKETDRRLNADVYTSFSCSAAEQKTAAETASLWLDTLARKRVPLSAAAWIRSFIGQVMSPLALAKRFSYCLRQYGLNQSLAGWLLALTEFLVAVAAHPSSRDQRLALLGNVHPQLREAGEALSAAHAGAVGAAEDADLAALGKSVLEEIHASSKTFRKLIFAGQAVILARQLKFELRMQLQRVESFEGRRLVARNFLHTVAGNHVLTDEAMEDLKVHFRCSAEMANDVCESFVINESVRLLVVELLLSFEVVSVDRFAEFAEKNLWSLLQPADISFPVRIKSSGLDTVARALKDLTRLTLLRSDSLDVTRVPMYISVGECAVRLLVGALALNPADGMIQSTMGTVYCELWRGSWDVFQHNVWLLLKTKSASGEALDNSATRIRTRTRAALHLEVFDVCKEMKGHYDKALAALSFEGNADLAFCRSAMNQLTAQAVTRFSVLMGEVHKLDPRLFEQLKPFVPVQLVAPDDALKTIDGLVTGANMHIPDDDDSGTAAEQVRFNNEMLKKNLHPQMVARLTDSTNATAKPDAASKAQEHREDRALQQLVVPADSLMCGFLHKKGEGWKGKKYRKRFFFLTPGRLTYGKKLDTRDTFGTVVEECGKIKIVAGSKVVYKQGRVKFQVKPADSKRVYTICAETHHDAEMWVKAIRGAVERDLSRSSVVQESLFSDALMQGLLKVRGEKSGAAYRACICALLRDGLVYDEKKPSAHTTSPNKDMAERISLLPGAAVCRSSKDARHIRVTPADSNRIFRLECESAEEADRWFAAIDTVIKSIRPSSTFG